MKCYRAGIRSHYVDIWKTKNERAMLSKFRIGAHETGRYMNIPKHERICAAGYSSEVANEEHFLLN